MISTTQIFRPEYCSPEARFIIKKYKNVFTEKIAYEHFKPLIYHDLFINLIIILVLTWLLWTLCPFAFSPPTTVLQGKGFEIPIRTIPVT